MLGAILGTRTYRAVAAVAAIATMTALAAATTSAPARAQAAASPDSVVETSPDIPAVTVRTRRLKPPLRGLVVTDARKLATVPYARRASMKLRWNAIETRRGVYDFSAVNRVLDAHPRVRFRLRFLAGIHAPRWVKDDAGGCVWITPDSRNGDSGCAARFWTRSYHRDYQALMRAVARRYERDWQVVEIPNSQCTTIYAEPFILGADDPSIDRLWRAGYTKSKHARCLRRSTRQLMLLFPRTRVSLAGHSKWQFIVASPRNPEDGVRSASWEAERTMLNRFIRRYGRHLVLEDHGLGPDDRECRTPGQRRRTAGSWYCYLAGLHRSPVAYGWQFTLNGGSMTALGPTKRRKVHKALWANCGD
jgi:hypothetical protein